MLALFDNTPYPFFSASQWFCDSFISLCCVLSLITLLFYHHSGRCLCIIGGIFLLFILMGCMMLISIVAGRFIIFVFLWLLFFAPLINAFSMLTMVAGCFHLSVQPISGCFACPIALPYCPCSVFCLIRTMALTC